MEPPNNFRHLSIYPTQSEILGATSYIRKNCIKGQFRDVDHYLDVQFRLLREDFIARLRDGIKSYRANEPTKDIEVYENISIFKDKDRYKIKVGPRSDESKEFMNGSLLLFTRNAFETTFFAKVVHRYPFEVTIDLMTNSLREGVKYTMAECTTYFDPYFNVLKALQTIPINNFPMEKYIVRVDTSAIYMPQYLLNSNCYYTIDGYRVSPRSLPKLNKNLNGLNNAQFKAFVAALTQEFVVIQGPPGTGKTFLGLKIAKALINNYHFWYRQSPMLVISHKNEALDQFLEGLIPITDRLIRVGGQSKNDNLKQFNLINEDQCRGRFSDHLATMRKALVVGMTTSIAARWREEYLEDLRCPIVIVEEAAEVLEAHVVAALTSHCQHLILLGDHKQLQPITSDHTIRTKYHLGISLFERMVNNDIQYYQLKVQHRMKPEISLPLKSTIYRNLEDHESTKNRPSIKGVDKNMFFIDHRYREESDNLITKRNVHEAKFLLSLARHLILNGYNPGSIVILSTYTGQVQELQQRAKKMSLLDDVKISTLDGFQGQESDIVLLSLVRSEAIGFLYAENRICVALSRARNGFYIMGNIKMLSNSSQLWNTVKRCLKERNAIGEELLLRCQIHPEMVTKAKSSGDFSQISHGGCSQKCQTVLPCGHRCHLMCHVLDRDHKVNTCQKGCRAPIKSRVSSPPIAVENKLATRFEPVRIPNYPLLLVLMFKNAMVYMLRWFLNVFK